MTFDAQIAHWTSISAFAAHLQGVPRPAWCKGVTIHNTYIPNETQWRGVVSVQGCMRTYVEKGWTSGPNLFLAASAPNPKDTGIFQLTPIAHPGTHAGACNADHLGIEVCGDFNARPPTTAQYTMLIAVTILILHAWGLPPDKVNVHNECMSGRTCPGKYLTGAQIRADLNKPRAPAVLHTVTAGPHGALAQEDRRPGALAARYYPPGTPIVCDDLQESYWHCHDGSGFIANGMVQA